MLGDLRPDRRDLGHLPPLHPGLAPHRPGPPAPAHAPRLMPDHVIRVIGQLHRRARLPLRPAGLAAGLLAQRLRRRLAQPVRATAAWRSSSSSASPAPPGPRPAPADPLPAPPPAPRLCASRSASSSRSRAFAARSPVTASASAAASPGTGGVSGTCRTPPRPAQRNQDDTPGRPQHSGPPRRRAQTPAPALSPHARTLRPPAPPAGQALHPAMLSSTGLPVSSSSSARSRSASAPPWPDTTPGRAASISTRTWSRSPPTDTAAIPRPPVLSAGAPAHRSPRCAAPGPS